jgi:hypothetical protein
MGEVSTIGLDIAKSVFPVHGVDGDGAVVSIVIISADAPSILGIASICHNVPAQL